MANFYAIILFLFSLQYLSSKITKFGDFPGSLVIKKLSFNAGDMGLIPGQEAKVLHASGQLSPCTPTAELTCHS